MIKKIKDKIVNVAKKAINIAKSVAKAIWNYRPFAATRGYIAGKWVSLVVLALMMSHYKSLPPQAFLELYYCAITVFGVALLGPLLRLILFAEMALYAENGRLLEDLDKSTVSVSLKNYWFVTAVSFLIPVFCFATVAK